MNGINLVAKLSIFLVWIYKYFAGTIEFQNKTLSPENRRSHPTNFGHTI